MPKISALNEITNPEPDDILAGVEDSAETTKYIKISTLLKFIYPVGSIYINKTDDTSPATLFGFGTWVRIQGQTIVGVSDSDPDFGEGDTGGQKTVGPHTHKIRSFMGATTNVLTLNDRNNDTILSSDNAVHGANGEYAAEGNYRSTESNTTDTNNMNPYATAYIWERTA